MKVIKRLRIFGNNLHCPWNFVVMLLLMYLRSFSHKTRNNCFDIRKFSFHSSASTSSLRNWSHHPNVHIFVDLPSIRCHNSTRNVRRDFINFKRWIHVEIMTSIQRGNFNLDLAFKIDEISMSFRHGFFYVVSISNRRNCFARCFLSFIFEYFLLWQHILS